MKKFACAVVLSALAFPLFAQTPEPPAEKTAPPLIERFFFGGGVGLAFGAVDYLEIAPLVGFKVVPRVDLGVQPFYRWTNDGRYSPSVEYTDYGTRLFTRIRIISSFFAEADFQFTSYEYADVYGGTSRATNNAFLAGAGYTVPIGRNAGLYFSALYDLTYDSANPNGPYDSPVQFQAGVAIGF